MKCRLHKHKNTGPVDMKETIEHKSQNFQAKKLGNFD